MSNNIVFQNQASSLKTAVYGYDGEVYQPIKVTDTGELQAIISTIQQVSSITSGTINKVNTVSSITNGTINKVNTLSSITGGTINKVSSITGGTITTVSSITNGTINKVNTLSSITNGTINKVNTVSSITGGTINKVTTVSSITNGTINKVNTVGSITGGTINAVGSITGGTITTVSSITNGTINKVNTLSSITNGTINKVNTVSSITNGTINKVNTLSSITGGTINKVSSITGGTVLIQGMTSSETLVNVKVDSTGLVYVGLYDRKFVESSETVTGVGTTPKYGEIIDTSKYQDTTWYIRNVTAGLVGAVTVQLAVAPTPGATYVPIGETSVLLSSSPKVITAEYYMHYTKLRIQGSLNLNRQDIEIWFNGRY